MKITETKNAAEQGIAEEEALKKGMEEKHLAPLEDRSNCNRLILRKLGNRSRHS
jgi:hypothetical protein